MGVRPDHYGRHSEATSDSHPFFVESCHCKVFLAGLAGVMLSACSSSSTGPTKSGPFSHPTLLVTNATCTPGPCTVLRVVGYPDVRTPVLPEPYIQYLGLATGPKTCITFADSSSVLIISVPTGPGDTTKVTWTLAYSFQLAAWDSAAPPPLFISSAPTAVLIPESQPGWAVTFPGSAGQAVAPAPPCTP